MLIPTNNNNNSLIIIIITFCIYNSTKTILLTILLKVNLVSWTMYKFRSESLMFLITVAPSTGLKKIILVQLIDFLLY